MSDAIAKLPYWVDSLHEKHECFSYDTGESAVVISNVNGRDVELVVPDWLSQFVVFVAVEHSELLFCIGRTNEKVRDKFCGLVMVAKRKTDTRYEVGVWHELYPWALTHFGFPNEVG